MKLDPMRQVEIEAMLLALLIAACVWMWLR